MVVVVQLLTTDKSWLALCTDLLGYYSALLCNTDTDKELERGQSCRDIQSTDKNTTE